MGVSLMLFCTVRRIRKTIIMYYQVITLNSLRRQTLLNKIFYSFEVWVYSFGPICLSYNTLNTTRAFLGECLCVHVSGERESERFTLAA